MVRFPQVKEDLAIFDIELSAAEMSALDKITEGKRTCTDCYTAECQARENGGTFCPLYIKMIFLPRQARDKHRKTHKVPFFLQACGQALIKAGCPVGALHGGFIWGRSNPNGTECVACAAKHEAAIAKVCNPGRGETLETMVPKACQI
jgi:hypothetical protein